MLVFIPSFRACTGLPPINHMLLEHKVPQLMATVSQPTTSVPVTKKTPVKTLNGHGINGMSHMTNGAGHVTNGTTAAVHVLG
jgi:hypothetical protein